MFWELITVFGGMEFWSILTIITFVLFLIFPKKLRKNITWFILTVLPSVFLSYFIVQVLKLIFKIPRPCFGLDFCPPSYSFPSGHASIIFAAVTVLVLHYNDNHLKISLLLFGGLVAISRLILNMHRLEDVVVGLIVGVVVGFLVQKIYINYQQKIKEIVSEIK